jgi:hypothetical protein
MIGARPFRLVLALVPAYFPPSPPQANNAGTWKRDLYGEGEVHMKLASNGEVELMLPSPRWPDSVDMKGRGRFTGDTLIFKADTTSRACQTKDASYVVRMNEEQLHIAGVGVDTCGNRRAALVGTWQKS